MYFFIFASCELLTLISGYPTVNRPFFFFFFFSFSTFDFFGLIIVYTKAFSLSGRQKYRHRGSLKHNNYIDYAFKLTVLTLINTINIVLNENSKVLKEPVLFFQLFLKLFEILVSRGVHIFLITHKKIMAKSRGVTGKIFLRGQSN